ncbi:MAG TPA: hypothetical protein DIW26_10335 [Ruminococcus sp.]|nr:hypothetical protein [Ruminococcus sp.]
MEDKNNPKLKTIFQQAREIDRKEQLEKEKKHLENQIQQQEEDEKKREEYEAILKQDKINLLKDKQNGSELNNDNEKTEKKYTLGQKISNFFYHNKWWLGIGCFFIIAAGYMIYDVATKVNPDMTIMLLVNDDLIYEKTAAVQELFGEYCGDRNGDGEINVSIYYMPLSEYIKNNQAEMYVSSQTQLTALLQTDSNLLIIADDESSALLREDDVLLSLEKYYPDNKNVKDTGFFLSDTDFAEKIGYTGDSIADDVYIGIRKVQKNASYADSMREHFNEDFEVLKEFIDDFS